MSQNIVRDRWYRSAQRAVRAVPLILLGCLTMSPASVHAAAAYVADSTPNDLVAAGVTSISKVSLAPSQATGNELVMQTLYDGTTFFTGVSFTRIQLEVPAAGTLRIQLTDLAFPAAAGLLNVSLVQGSEVAAILPAPGELDFEISEPGRFFAYVQAVGAPGISVASYYLNITHTSAIPLPAAFWLLLSGILAVGRAATLRRRATKA